MLMEMAVMEYETTSTHISSWSEKNDDFQQ